ncbi:MAG: uncharacterized protein JWM36_4359 [Hyphomicrobiales bacterium]|nr:uncharacterized protein [Hyphomicrobiales bacterium]
MGRPHKPSSLTNRVPSHYARRPDVMPKVWYVVICNVNCEKRAELGLRQKGFVTYLPLLKKTVVLGRRKAKVSVERPLFTRYLFVSSLRREMPFYHLRSTNGVESIVRSDGLPIPIPGELIEEIMAREDKGEFDSTREPRDLKEVGLTIGQSTEVVSGPFQGVKATIRKLLPGWRAEVLIRMMGHDMPFRMGLADLKVVS